jgi:transcriptional regulator with XRE-family HTH domain
MTDKELLIIIGNNIRKIRLRKNITQVELAEKCDFEKSNMRRIEAGNTNPTIKTLFKIANGLDVAISDLLKETKIK